MAKPLQIKDIPLNGKVITSRDSATIGANFQQLTNMEYTDTHPKGIPGMTKVNSTLLSNTKIRGGFHYRKEQPAESHVLVQSLNSAETSSSIYDSSGKIQGTQYQDFTTYTETDVGGVVTVAANTITLTNGGRDADFYATEDFGAYHFKDFVHAVDVNITATSSGISSGMYCWALTNSDDDLGDIDTAATEDALYLLAGRSSATEYIFVIYSLSKGTQSSVDTSSAITIGEESFVTITRSGTTITVEIYSTNALRIAGSSGDVDTITGSVVATEFRYLQGIASYNTSTASSTISGTIKNLNVESFNTTAILDQATGFGTSRFSTAPNNNMAMCDKSGSYVWGGDEKLCSAFITSTAAVTDTITNPRDYTKEVTNTLATASEVAVIGGGKDSDTKLLLHFDEADTGTDFDDSSASAHGTTANGAAQIDTSQKKFGIGSGLFDGDGDYVVVGDHADFNFGTGDFTIDFWVRFDTGRWEDHQYIVTQWEDASNYWKITKVDSGGDHRLEMAFANAGYQGYYYTSYGDWTDAAAGTWFHLAFVRNSTTGLIFINGVSQTTTENTAFGTNDVGDLAADLWVGGNNSAGGITQEFGGHLDELRITKGVARWTTDFEPPARAYSAAATNWLVGATRPLKGVKFYVGDANGQASTMTVKEWNGTSWTALTATDNTDTGASLATTGTVTWSTTESTSKIKYLNGLALYWYQFSIDAGSATIYHCTVDAAMQPVKDIWDGMERSIASFQVYDATAVAYADDTVKVFSDNYDDQNKGTYSKIVSLATATEWVLTGFPERMLGVNVNIVTVDGVIKGNTTAATTLTMSYWDGAAWSELSGVTDGTSRNSISLAESGVISWQPPEKGEEFTQEIGNYPPLYHYKLSFDKTLSADVQVFYISGIPAQKTINAHSFPIHAGNSLWLCSEQDGDKNKMIRTQPGTSSVFNGDGYTEFYVGDESELMAGAVIYSQLGSNLYEVLVVCKKSETHILVPTSAGIETFLVAGHIGCVAPGTMKSLNVGDVTTGLHRNVCMWQGAEGIYMFDGRSPVRVSDDIQDIFDKNNSSGLNRSYPHVSYGFFDIENYRYHWVFASATATVPDAEWVYDIKRKRWFQIDRGAGNDLMGGLEVESTLGVPYAYGFDNSGQVYRLNNGTDFDGADIVHTLHTGEAPMEGTIMLETKLRRINLVCKATNTTTNTITATLYGDGSTTAADTATLEPQASGKSIAQTRESVKSDAVFHSIKLAMTTDDETVGFEPMYLGAFYRPSRMV